MFNSVEKLIALRNLRPKKKEGFLKVISAFSFVGIMLGVAVLIIVMSVMNGFRTDLTNKILGFNPHIIVKPYNNVKIDNDFKKKLSDSFNKIEYLESFSGEGVVMRTETTKGVIIKGLDQNNKKNFSFLKKILVEGNKYEIKNNEVVVGKQLAINLNLQVGDKINLLSSSFISTPFGGLPKQEAFVVKGIFSSGFYEFDQNVIFLNLNQTLNFFNKTEKDINLEIYLQNPLEADRIKDQIQELESNLFIYCWFDLNKSFFGALKLIIIVAAFNIISGLTILIKNKTKEIAILKTLGLNNKSIVKSFFLTGFTIGLVATVAGIILGILFASNIELIRIFLSNILQVEIFPADVYFLDKMPSEINLISILLIFILSIITTTIASLIPALSIAKMNTIQALKYE